MHSLHIDAHINNYSYEHGVGDGGYLVIGPHTALLWSPWPGWYSGSPSSWKWRTTCPRARRMACGAHESHLYVLGCAGIRYAMPCVYAKNSYNYE